MAIESDNTLNQFSGELDKQTSPAYLPKNTISHSRNSINVSPTGDRGTLGNEPANFNCITAPYPIIGYIYLYDDNWIVFSTDDIHSEIGLFKEFTCEYQKLPGDHTCLSFNRSNLITGISRRNFDCTWSVYFSDGYKNSDRTLNINNVPLVGQYLINTDGCRYFLPDVPNLLDCEQLKLNRDVSIPCLSITKGSGGGNLLNGSYYATIAYTVEGQKVTDFLGLSNVIGIFDHNNESGSINIDISGLDDSYDQYELIVISIVNGQTFAKNIGLFSTNQHHIPIDIIPNDLIDVPIKFIPIRTPLMESSKSITELDDRMLRIAPKSKFDFNYQPYANLITANWQVIEYPADYYRNGGVNTNFLRDENYGFILRWIYRDSDRSSSYSIPGRPPFAGEQDIVTGIYDDTYQFELVNSATLDDTTVTPLGDGGYIIGEGTMGYHEIDDVYPDNQPAVWGDLCGKKIRLHKFPDRSLSDRTDIYSDTAISPIIGPVIRVLAVKFYNIATPLDNEGKPITDIVGYEILKASRQGNKTIIAKGIINNLFDYTLLDGSGKQGVYANFPYNSLENDPYISTTITTTPANGVVANLNPNTYNDSRSNLVTFHSPDTTFRHPFLPTQELKLDGLVVGTPVLKFIEPDKHPKHKLLTNLAFYIAAIGGIGYAALKLNGSRSTSAESSMVPGTTALAAPFIGTSNSLGFIAELAGAFVLLGGFLDDHNSIENVKDNFGDIVQARDRNVDTIEQGDRKGIATDSGALASGGFSGGKQTSTTSGGIGKAIGNFFRGSSNGGLSLFVNYWSEGTDVTLQLIYNLSQYQQYALQQVSHCFYNGYSRPTFGGTSPKTLSFLIETAKYIGNTFQDLDNDLKINNLYRASTVAIKTTQTLPKPNNLDSLHTLPSNYVNNVEDDSKQNLRTISVISPEIHEDPTNHSVSVTASSFYASYKVRLRNQYGQLYNIKQIPIGCVNAVIIPSDNLPIFQSPTIFGGDTYITRYTEKNTMFFFYEWLYGQPDAFEYNYFQRRYLQYPAYWADTQKFDTGDFVRGIADNLGGAIVALTGSLTGNSTPNDFKSSPWLPSNFRALDRKIGTGDGFNNLFDHKQSYFVVKSAYFYLFCSGIRDFYVESEVNLGYRDWEEPIIKRYYDYASFTDINEMFNAKPETIKADNFYKYDYSLSISNSFVNMSSWGSFQPTYYDPQIAEHCYTVNPKRVSYSLPQQADQIRDSWRVFLANNYRDFRSDITQIQSIGKTAAIVFFKTDTPIQIQGEEILRTDAGTEISIGSGSFLSREAQSISNADREYRYGACLDLRSIVNTPAGLFWISNQQGKIFTINQGLIDIAMPDMIWWFNKYLPYQILNDFPNFDLIGNPVMGVGCQTVYDSENGIIYFTKKDYRLKTDSLIGMVAAYVPGGVNFTGGIIFNAHYQFGLYSAFAAHGPPPLLGGFNIGDPLYMEDVSWTASYDVKTRQWLSWHDWHPDLVMPSKTNFFTIKSGGIWKHNQRCDLYCNYYGIDYPWEIEYEAYTGLKDNTLRSLEYYLEVYKYADNCYDRYLYLYENFDDLIVFNNEQTSGLLKLNLNPDNDPFLAQQYPIYNLTNVDILYSKVESKYRVNQFHDLTDDRGEFTSARRTIWSTENNGYIKVLNDTNLNYQKSVLQQKAIRGYTSSVFFRKNVSGDRKFIMLFSVNKNLESKR